MGTPAFRSPGPPVAAPLRLLVGGDPVHEDPLQVPLQDQPLREEIELLTELMVAASLAVGRLEPALIDQALGLGRPRA